MEHYLGVKVQKGLFKSPLRRDRHSTCSFYRNKSGRLIMKDFSGAFIGDCFSVVQEKFGVSYYMALQIIANDFGIIHRSELKVNKPKLEYTGSVLEKSEQSRIQVEIREWDEIDLDWWGKYGISKETLDKFKVYPCKTVWLNGNIFYIFTGTERCYGYFGGIKDGIEYWRIYFPRRRSWKFIANWKGTQIQGAHMLSKKGGNYVVVTKSMKDVMVLYEYGIPAIAPCSENLFITDSQYERLKKKYKRVVLLYDNDEPGLHAAWTIRKSHPDLEVIYLPINGGDKDISDFRKAHGNKKTLELINKVKSYYDEKVEERSEPGGESERNSEKEEEEWSI